MSEEKKLSDEALRALEQQLDGLLVLIPPESQLALLFNQLTRIYVDNPLLYPPPRLVKLFLDSSAIHEGAIELLEESRLFYQVRVRRSDGQTRNFTIKA